MQTLVLKAQESVENDNLRTMNELRFKLVKGTNAELRGYFSKLKSSGSSKDVIYKVVKGTAHFHTSYSSEGSFTTITVSGANNAPFVSVQSDEAEVSITNFDLVADILGIDSDHPFYHSQAVGGVNTGCPKVKMNCKELKDKNFVKSIYLEGGLIGNVEYLPSSMEKFHVTSNEVLTGDLGHIINNGMEGLYLYMGSDQSTLNYSFAELQGLHPTASIYIRKGVCQGGDIYELIKSREELDLELLFVKNKSFTCSYTNGDSIPTMEIKKLIIGSYSVYPTVDDAVALLTLLKDGYDANKITLPSTIRIVLASADRNKTAITTLVSDLSSRGCTVTLQ